MPELPEVESVRRQVLPLVQGRVITAVNRDPYPSRRIYALDDAVNGQIETVVRRGKYLLLPLKDPTSGSCTRELVIHLGMTGVLGFDPAKGHVRVSFTLDGTDTLLFSDPRRFGRVCVVPAGTYDSIPTLQTLGPEPLSDAFSVAGFAAALKRSHTPIKAALLNQRVVAGVGNIYADEALWASHIHPASRRVGATRAGVLHHELVRILTAAVAREGTTFRNYQLVNGASGRFASSLHVYGKSGSNCPRCDTPFRKTVIAQRGTTFCPSCQRH
jgi:formamidopyrimidine-DNA glycosylase